jgi:hypothetical protein
MEGRSRGEEESKVDQALDGGGVWVDLIEKMSILFIHCSITKYLKT